VEPRSQALAAVERQTAVLVRHFELLNRRGAVHELLDRSEYLLLRILDETGPADINTLAAALGLNPSTAGRQVSALLASGLAERATDSDDRRRCVVTPTELGNRRMHEVQRMRTENTADLLSDWNDEDLGVLAAMFNKYNTSVADKYLTGAGQQPGAEEAG
jgi:DNA-binding MarR family transcriptional regulator